MKRKLQAALFDWRPWASPAVPRAGATDAVVIRTGPIGFAGAAEAERLRWINAFRRLLDGLDSPIQVVIQVEPGTGPEKPYEARVSLDLNHTRSADIGFVEEVSRSPAGQRTQVVFDMMEQRGRPNVVIAEIALGERPSPPYEYVSELE